MATLCIIDPLHGGATHHERCQACYNRLRRTDLAYLVREQNRKYLSNYGLTRDEVQELKASQHYRCALCGVPEELTERGLVIEHDHKTGLIRGASCSSCNLGLAHFTENPATLRAAIKYLKAAS